MKEIVIISGKGGTGKTSVTAAFACLGGRDVIVADCDVDAADMHLLLEPDFRESEEFLSGELAVIRQDACTACGKCLEVCRFDAILVDGERYKVDPLNCEGCGYCSRVCPEEAIMNLKRVAGQWYVSGIKTGSTMVHAKLEIGADNSGKLVAKVKKEARRIAETRKKDIILIDGSPGIGCPVISSLSGAAYVVLVTEPTVSGLHDLKRVYELVRKFKLFAACIINKSDLNMQATAEIKTFLQEEGIPLLATLPYDEAFTMAMTMGQTIVEYSRGHLTEIITESYNTIMNQLS